MNKYFFFLFGLLFMVSCKQDSTSSYEEISLLEYGVPISVKVPPGATVKKEDLGFMTDITIKEGEDFYLQIFSSDALTLDAAKLKADRLAEVKKGPYFSKIIEEYDDGFIFEKKVDENNINFDFRHVKVQGDMEYIFRTGLIGKFSEEEVRSMYKVSKEAK